MGYSYSQIKNPEKGLSFNSSGDLNMRMGINSFSAKEVINKLGKKNLKKFLNFLEMKKKQKKFHSKLFKRGKKRN